MLSVIIPCRNEQQYIENCVRSVLSQERPPGGMEVIIADGISDDGTREILNNLSREYQELRIVDNVSRVTPSGMNAGIAQARGHYIAILGAHCNYASNYLRTCVELLDRHPGVSCVGGPIVSVGKSLLGQAVAAAMSHPVGIGNARHRYPDFEGYAEGACYPVFRREVFETIGVYDETLVRNQDDELNYRLAKQGGRVFLSSRAKSTYFVRESLGALFRQYYEYGYWRVAVIRKHGAPASFRHLIPPVFLSGLWGLGTTTFFVPEGWRFGLLSVPCLYVLILCSVGLYQMARLGWKVGLLFPIAAATMHFAYAFGFMWGVFHAPRVSTKLQTPVESTTLAKSPKPDSVRP